MHLHYFQHVSFEGLGCIEQWAADKGHQLSSTRWYEMPGLHPAWETADWLIIMGGPMGVNEQQQYPWIGEELRAIQAAVEQGKKVLGICLGAQLIAAALGAAVYPNPQKEIGWFPVTFSTDLLPTGLQEILPPAVTVFHWHGDTYAVPSGAVIFASSDVCAHQAFIFQERVMGLQFHLEVTAAAVEDMLVHGAAELQPADRIQSAEIIREQQQQHITTNNQLMYRLLDYLADRHSLKQGK